MPSPVELALSTSRQTSYSAQLHTIMDAYSAYAYSTGAWLSLQALPLLVSPKLIVTMLSPDTRRPTGTPSTTHRHPSTGADP